MQHHNVAELEKYTHQRMAELVKYTYVAVWLIQESIYCRMTKIGQYVLYILWLKQKSKVCIAVWLNQKCVYWSEVSKSCYFLTGFKSLFSCLARFTLILVPPLLAVPGFLPKFMSLNVRYLIYYVIIQKKDIYYPLLLQTLKITF